VSDYAVNVHVPADSGQNRLWGIPIFGISVRAIMVIPQAIILFFLAIAMAVVFLVSWIPILLTGRMAAWGYAITGGYLRLAAQTALYVLLITGRYPPFGLSGDSPIDVVFDETEQQNRLWGIPFLGVWLRVILLIPHFIVLWLLGIGVGLLVIVSWIPVLLSGRQADSIVSYVGGYYRWAARVASYALLLTGKYPPFRLGQ
jgi:Domain of unknown function (DUF4389)